MNYSSSGLTVRSFFPSLTPLPPFAAETASSIWSVSGTEASRRLMSERAQLQKEVLQRRDRIRKLLATLGCGENIDRKGFASRLAGNEVRCHDGTSLPMSVMRACWLRRPYGDVAGRCACSELRHHAKRQNSFADPECTLHRWLAAKRHIRTMSIVAQIHEIGE